MMVTVVNVVNDNRDYQETNDVVNVSVWKSLEDIVPQSETEYMAEEGTWKSLEWQGTSCSKFMMEFHVFCEDVYIFMFTQHVDTGFQEHWCRKGTLLCRTPIYAYINFSKVRPKLLILGFPTWSIHESIHESNSPKPLKQGTIGRVVSFLGGRGSSFEAIRPSQKLLSMFSLQLNGGFLK